MHYVSIQPNKERLRPLQVPVLGHQCIRETQHLQTPVSLHKYLCNSGLSLLPVALSK